MKKTLSILLVFALICSMGYGLEGRMQGRMIGSRDDATVTDQLKALGGLTFYMSVADGANSLDADYSLGSPTATFTRTGGATKPATYIDANGVVQVATTTDAVRYQDGYYDSSGETSINTGVVLESASENLLVRTDGTAASGNLWTGWSDAGNTAETSVKAQVAATALTSISGSKYMTWAYVDGADTGKNVRTISSDTAAGTVLNTNIIILSFWARTTGITGAQFKSQIRTRSAVPANLTTTSTNHTLTSSWARYEQVHTVADATSDRANVLFGFNNDVDQGDVLEFELWGVQLEVAAYPSSFIPTTSAALTRNTEALSYATSKNFVGGTDGSILMKYRPVMLPDEQGTENALLLQVLIDANNGWRLLHGANADDFARFQTESATTNITTDTAAEPYSSSRYSTHTLVGTFSTTADGSSIKQAIYLDGVQAADTDGTYTTPVGSLPATFTVQLTAGQAMILESVVIYSKRLSATEVALVDTILE